jgi:hypothetical protein
MGKKLRSKMPREQRAKQFAPFQAVGGLEEALRRAEEEHRRMLETGNVVNVPVEDTDNTEENEG